MSSRVRLVDRDSRVAGVDDRFQHLLPGEGDRDANHVGPRRHDGRDIDVAQFNDPFDHLPGVFFQEPFAVAFGDERANLLFERILIEDLLGASHEAMEEGVDESGAEDQRS